MLSKLLLAPMIGSSKETQSLTTKHSYRYYDHLYWYWYYYYYYCYCYYYYYYHYTNP